MCLQAETLRKGKDLQVSQKEARSPIKSGSTYEAFFRISAVAIVGTIIISLVEGGSIRTFTASNAAEPSLT